MDDRERVVGMEAQGGAGGVDHPSRGRWLDAGLLFLFALAVRLRDLSFAPDVDEFHHILAAQSLLTEGNLSMASGDIPYTRGLLFTLLVAGFFALFGDSVEVARLPAILGGALLVAVLYLWVRASSNRLAGWISALLLCTYPFGIYLTQVTRFYSLHALFFLLGVMAAYRLAGGGPYGRRELVAFAGGGVFALVLAFHFQVATVVGIGALGLWLALDRGPWAIAWMQSVRTPWVPMTAAAAVVVAGLALIWTTGFHARALHLFQYADPWAFEQRDNTRYYHWRLQADYGPMWALFPAVVLVTLYRNWRFALVCALIFSTVFLVHSFAAWKHPRYIFYAMPFFFALVGVAGAELARSLRAALDVVLVRIGRWGEARAVCGAVYGGGALVVSGFLLLGLGAFSDFTKMMQSGPDPLDAPRPYRGKAEWAMATPTLQELGREAEVLISYSHLKPPYYLGRLDVILQRNHLYLRDRWAPEFTVQHQLAVPVISRPESLAGIVACHESGMVIGEHFGWRDPAGVPAETVEWIEAHLEPVLLPPEWRLLVYTWDREAALDLMEVPVGLDCAAIPIGPQLGGNGS